MPTTSENVCLLYDQLKKLSSGKPSREELIQEMNDHRFVDEKLQEFFASLIQGEKQLCVERAEEIFQFEVLTNSDNEPYRAKQVYFYRPFITGDGKTLPMTKASSQIIQCLETLFMDAYVDMKIVQNASIAAKFLWEETRTTIHAIYAEGIMMHLKKRALEDSKQKETLSTLN